MTEHKVPVQSLIDHIKTAVDVDPWAKEMAEELLEKQEPKPVKVVKNVYNHEFYYCPRCDRSFYDLYYGKPKFCDKCGQEITWNG